MWRPALPYLPGARPHLVQVLLIRIVALSGKTNSEGYRPSRCSGSWKIESLTPWRRQTSVTSSPQGSISKVAVIRKSRRSRTIFW